ncbi:hypothetical protein BG004_007065 [Podila humilis]|nr:hypothetical protein BG004_007065 [Podila humilis]
MMGTNGNHVSRKILTSQNMNPNVRRAEYAVRGELAIRSEALKAELANGVSHPFDRVVGCNIGNPQALNQKPITFFRQVASLVEYPTLLQEENAEVVSKLYPSDAIARAKLLLNSIGSSSIGAYSHSQGIPHIRENVARFISERDDGYPADPSMIFLTQGASAGVQLTLQMIVEHPKVGIMIPIPQYPLYTATLAVLDANPVPYYLDEDKHWGLTTAELQRSYDESVKNGIDTRALVIINPGNPTGQCLSKENMQEIIEFCRKNRVILLADEVYQTNIYHHERPFHSFKKVLKSMGPDYEGFEMISYHSISKGMIGECGRRGGYFECEGLDKSIMEQIYKISSISLCPNVQGQIMVDLMVNPPKKGDPSFESYKAEYDAIKSSLIKRASILEKMFNTLEGYSCNPADGAMYLFPQIRLPKKAIEAAVKIGQQPDQFYCMAMLEATGVCMVAGSGFGQVDGTAHFRSTFLPQPELFEGFCKGIKDFHADFMNKYRD